MNRWLWGRVDDPYTSRPETDHNPKKKKKKRVNTVPYSKDYGPVPTGLVDVRSRVGPSSHLQITLPTSSLVKQTPLSC